MLAPVDAEPAIEERGGLLVITGVVEVEWADHRDLRDERLARLGGGAE